MYTAIGFGEELTLKLKNETPPVKKLETINHVFLLSGISLVVIFLFLALRNTGLYPSVFADEYTYSKLSRLMPLSESTIPSYLYLKLYSVTNYCGDGFLGCAKIINSFLFVATAPFIFLTARRLTGEGVSAYISLLSIIGPISSYTAYFMPESFYFFSFWVVCWYLLSLDHKSASYRWCAAGALYAISSLIKPHSLLYLPAIFLYVGFVFYRAQALFSKASGIALVCVMLGVGVAKFGTSYILAGSSGLTIFGPFYGATVSSVSSGSGKYIDLLLLGLESLKGHMLVIGLIYGLPLVLAVVATTRTFFVRNDLEDNSGCRVAHYEKLAFLSLIVILNLICLVALFTASVANSGPYETPYRLHMRYYNFALPLFYLIAAGALSTAADAKGPVRYILGGIFAAVGVFAIWSNLAPYAPSYIDSPEVRGLHVDHLYFRVVGGLLISALVLWLFVQRKGLQLYLYIALPFFVVLSTFHIGLELNNRLGQDVYDRAGVFTRQYLTNEDLSKTIIVGSEPAGLFRSLFYLDNSQASLEVIQRYADYDLAKLPGGKEWILLIGDHEVKGISFYQIPMSGFSLIRASGEYVLDFRKAAWPGVIRKVQGLSTPERWGTWSQSDSVIFEFAGSLPSRLEVHLVAHAFGPNADKEFEASLGGEVAKFRLSENGEQQIIHLNNPKGSNVLRFKIPSAMSPKALGLSGDDRNLGIGFVEMKIVTIE